MDNCVVLHIYSRSVSNTRLNVPKEEILLNDKRTRLRHILIIKLHVQNEQA